MNSRGVGSRVFFVGQNPGVREDEEGKCFVGPSGHVLGALVRLAGIRLEDAYFGNAIRCLTPGNRTPKKDEIANCRPYLLEEIDEKRPELIVALGAIALESLYGKVPLGTVAGQTLTHRGTPLLPTWHPAAIMRNWALAPLVLAHFEKVKRILDGTLEPDELHYYQTVQTIDELLVLQQECLSPPQGFISLDSETTGTDWKEDELLGLSFSVERGTGWFVPILGQGVVTLDFWKGQYPEVIRIIGEILSSPVPKALQNGAFDTRFLEREYDQPWISAATSFGWQVNNIQHDTMLLNKALHEEMPKESKPNELARLVSLHTSLPSYDEDVRRQSKNKTQMSEVENDVLWEYGAADADAVSRLVPTLRSQVDAEGMGWVMDNITIPMLRVCQQMTVRGILVDVPYMKKLSAYYGEKIDEAKGSLTIEVGEFNLNSPVQVQDVLHKRLGLPKTGRKTNASRECVACEAGECEKHDSTDKNALAELYALTKHPFLETFMEYRQLVKMKGTYLDGNNDDGEPGGFLRHVCLDGRLHAEFKVGGAESGRLSAANPAVQTPPKDLPIPEWGLEQAFRRCFVAPEGSVILEADDSQLEVWANAYLADDQDFLEILHSGKDIHVHVARGIWPEDPELTDEEWKEQHDDLRRRGKDFVFGTQYGLTVAGVQERQNCDEDEAKRLLDLYFDLRPRLKDYLDEIRSAVLKGETLTTPSGRRFHFPQVPILQATQRGAGKQIWRICQNELEAVVREGVNRPTQSSGSDLFSLQHIWTEHTPILEGRFRPNLAVHDSVVGEAYAPGQEFVIETAWKIKEHWQRIAKDTVLPNGKLLGWEIPVAVSWGQSWGTMDSRLSPKGELYLPEPEAAKV